MDRFIPICLIEIFEKSVVLEERYRMEDGGKNLGYSSFLHVFSMGPLRVSGFLNELPLKGMEFFLYKKICFFLRMKEMVNT